MNAAWWGLGIAPFKLPLPGRLLRPVTSLSFVASMTEEAAPSTLRADPSALSPTGTSGALSPGINQAVLSNVIS